jgi:hypothetical protein
MFLVCRTEITAEPFPVAKSRVFRQTTRNGRETHCHRARPVMGVRQQQKFVDYIVVGNHNFVAQLGDHPHSLAVSQGASCVERGPVIGDERFEEREGFCVLQRYMAAAYQTEHDLFLLPAYRVSHDQIAIIEPAPPGQRTRAGSRACQSARKRDPESALNRHQRLRSGRDVVAGIGWVAAEGLTGPGGPRLRILILQF